MDAQIFLDNFAAIAEAPRGVQRLRDLVLELAVTGRLVPNDTDAQATNRLISAAADARADLVERRLVPKPRAFTAEVDPPPFTLPSTWAWTDLDSISVYIQRGKSPKYASAPTSTPVISQKCVQWSGFDLGAARYVVEESLLGYGPERFVRAGDLLWNSTGTGTVGRVIAVPEGLPVDRMVADSHVTVIRLANSHPQFVRAWIASTFVQSRIQDLTSGTTQQQELNTSTVRGLGVPLPPGSEQERIVAKVDELMVLCDDLEAHAHRRHSVTTRFRSSALDALTEAEAPGDLKRAWERVSNNWTVATGDAAAVTAVRDAVIQLAVEGRLSTGHADDEPAESILEECLRHKAELVASGGRSRSDLEPVSGNELPFPLPRGWALARLDRWCDIGGGLAKGRKIAGKATAHLPYLRVANVKAGYLALDEIKHIEVPTDEVERYSLVAGDVLLTEGGDWDKLGRSAIWTGEIEPCLHQNHVFRARSLSSALRPEWISLVTNSGTGRAYFQSKAKRTTNLASINMTELRSMPLPVPPAAEQVRILTAIDNLTSQLTRLDDALARRERASAMLADGLARAVSR